MVSVAARGRAGNSDSDSGGEGADAGRPAREGVNVLFTDRGFATEVLPLRGSRFMPMVGVVSVGIDPERGRTTEARPCACSPNKATDGSNAGADIAESEGEGEDAPIACEGSA